MTWHATEEAAKHASSAAKHKVVGAVMNKHDTRMSFGQVRYIAIRLILGWALSSVVVYS